MIKALFQTLKIDVYYSVNSFLFLLKKFPIFKDLLTNDVYQSKTIKTFVGIIGSIFSFFRAALMQFLYFFVILVVSVRLLSSSLSTFIHVYFFLTFLGLFINNKLLTSSKKKYFSLILFQMDGTQFFHANLLWNLFTRFLFSTIGILIIVMGYYQASLYEGLILIMFTLSFRIIGEYFNIMFFRRYHYIWYSNTKIYFSIFFLCIALCFLPFFSIIVPFWVIELFTFISFVLGVSSFIALWKTNDYYYLYKRIHNITEVMNSKEEGDYLRQAMVEVKEKDKKIDTSLLEKKHGYDLFNTIFFERHKEILLRSARRYAVVAAVVYVILLYVIMHYANYYQSIEYFLEYKLSFFSIIMFYINRGSIITRAMFFNCDHAMLCFNFYREPRIILELFKKRLLTIVKVNLIPAFVIGVGNSLILFVTTSSVITLLTSFLFIISLSVFFSVHYLVIYYLLQPYNKNMEVKKIGYSLVTILTYLVSFWLKDIILSSAVLSVLGLLFVILYLVLALWLVYRIAPRTFRLY